MARLFAALGYPQEALPGLIAMAEKVSIFHAASACSGHVRDGRPRQWPDVFDRRLKDLFIDRFGDALIRLDYEVNHDW